MTNVEHTQETNKGLSGSDTSAQNLIIAPLLGWIKVLSDPLSNHAEL